LICDKAAGRDRRTLWAARYACLDTGDAMQAIESQLMFFLVHTLPALVLILVTLAITVAAFG
jgi:hypothetical protein